MVEVVCALIRRGDTMLICQRPLGMTLELHWEFPGGKVEPGETKREALARECNEELGVRVEVGDELTNVEYMYPDEDIDLTLFETSIMDGEPVKIEHNDMKWVTAAELENYRFCPADDVILDYLRVRAAGGPA